MKKVTDNLISDYKNFFAMVGIVELKEILSNIEENCNSLKELEKIPSLYSKVAPLCKEAIKELEAERENYMEEFSVS